MPSTASHPGDRIDPGRFKRRILLAVTGLAPQVVTETLYALATGPHPESLPNEVHLVTTAEGAERARLALLSREPGWFHRLREEYDLPDIAFDETRIHVIPDAQGQPLSDIRTPADNLMAADFITEQVRQLTHDEDSALHVSIAGGRKTMGFFLGYALSLFGRPQDRLSHVLVSKPFESTWDFFYPSRDSRVLTTRNDDNLVDARDAQVTLAEIPFVSLRHGLDDRLMAGKASYKEVVESAQEGLAPPSVRLHLPTRKVRLGRKTLTLSPSHMALYCLFARRATEGDPPLEAPGKGVPDPEWAERYLQMLKELSDPMADLDKTERALAHGMDGEYFSQALSKLHRRLRAALGTMAGPYLIHDGGARPRRYSLDLPPSSIHFSDDPLTD
ncbi:CRISPR-associated protein, NE0113 family [Ectothiorhodospira magna]|uniref:CRISPR-associated protein, NE0113 family n=2 Tax=Ectothiorhodospira magna TaxID=867345 RepID=A0A1H9GC14_9GAMM|nr:CRISPR-associated protein, NE0113 family [Ectothiorhodospira magna]